MWRPGRVGEREIDPLERRPDGAGDRPLMAGRSEGVDYAGDTAAGARIIENLNYVI